MSRTDRKSEEAAETAKADPASGKSGKNPGQKTVEEEEERMDEHFFYGNLPVLDYKLSDGTKGSVDQIPR
jgi:hypothetical protein